MAIPLIVLGFGSIFSGYILKDLMVGVGTPFFAESIYIDPRNSSLVDAEFLPVGVKLIPTAYSLFGLWLGVFIHKYKGINLEVLFFNGRLFNFLSNK
jgi:NADH-ubiquinone oxidoreductase chain 5